jgi:5,10-methylenetetrahydromethanopterin reductase
MFDRARPPEDLVAFAREVEAMGLDELWVVEDCFWTGGLTSAAAALTATTSLTVGLGIAPAPLRNVALLAMECANLARLAPGRFVAGVGHGVQDWMAQVGEQVDSPLTLLDETVRALRALLHGATVTTEGRYVQLRDVTLVHPPHVAPPVVTGVVRPKSLELSGRVADGTILCEGTSPAAVATQRAHIERGRAAAAVAHGGPVGSAPAVHEIVVFAHLSIDDDPLRARAALGSTIDDIARFQGVTPADDLAVWGSPVSVAEAVRRYERVGVDSLVLRPVGADASGQVRALLRAVAG